MFNCGSEGEFDVFYSRSRLRYPELRSAFWSGGLRTCVLASLHSVMRLTSLFGPEKVVHIYWTRENDLNAC